MVKIRAAQALDAAAIAAIWNVEIRDGVSTFTTEEKSTAAVAQAIEGGQVFLVAQSEARVLGFACLSAFRSGPGYSRTVEHSVYLAADARGQGAGRALLAALAQVAADQGHHVMVAAVGGENASAIGFHKRQGFEEVARMPEVGRKFGRWMDLVLLQKSL